MLGHNDGDEVDGRDEGLDEGLGDGCKVERVGSIVETKVGVGDGCRLGAWVGIINGSIVGNGEVAETDASDGNSVGIAEGDAVGMAEGQDVGLVEGAMLGAAEGLIVGAIEG